MKVLILLAGIFFVYILWSLVNSLFFPFVEKKYDFSGGKTIHANKKISIASYNLALLSIRVFWITLLEPAWFVKKRLETFPKLFKESAIDVLFLQEVFLDKSKIYLINKLKKEYPFSVYYKKSYKLNASYQNGLLILSKYPIKSSSFVSEKNQMFHERLSTNKWILEVKIDLWKNKNISIVNAHNVARWVFCGENCKRVVNYKLKQNNEIMEFALKNKSDFIVWDYNCGPNFFTNIYEQFSKKWFSEVFEILHPDKRIITWDPENILTQSKLFSVTPPQKDDHIFVNETSRKKYEIKKANIIFDKKILKTWNIQYPTSDHYWIYAEIELK